MSTKTQDIEVISHFPSQASSAYKDAIDFIEINPSFALLQFRKILECFSLFLAEHCHVEFEEANLYEQISILHEYQVLNFSSKRLWNQLRINGNKGAHSNILKFGNKDSANYSKLAINSREILIEIAIEILDYCKIEFIQFKSIDFVKSKNFTLGKVISEAIMSYSFDKKMKAALLLNSVSKEVGDYKQTEEMFNDIENCRIRSAFYRSAIQISANASVSDFDSSMSLSIKKIANKADPEAVYLYAEMNLIPDIKDETVHDAIKLNKIIADRGYSLACLRYGVLTTNDDFSFYNCDESILYLEKAAKYGEISAYSYLYDIYKKSGPMPNSRKALQYLRKGIDMGCGECHFFLAEIYSNGWYGQARDMAKSEEHIEKAESLGSETLASFKLGLQNQLEKQKLESLVQMRTENKITSPVKSNKIKPNELCPCGSGKKYKKCCNSSRSINKLKNNTLIPTAY